MSMPSTVTPSSAFQLERFGFGQSALGEKPVEVGDRLGVCEVIQVRPRDRVR